MKWTDSNIKFLKENYDKLTKQELADNLKTTFRSIEVKMIRLKLSSRDRKWEIIKCINCNKEIRCLKKHKRKFCSNSCSAIYTNPLKEKRSRESRRKTSESLKNNVNRRKITILNLPNCTICGNICKKYDRIYCSHKCRSKCPKLRENASIRMREKFSKNPELHPNRLCAGVKESYPERMLTEYLNNLEFKEGIDYIKQFPFDKYFIDFLFPGLNLAIEVDGRYWHDPNSEKEIVRENRIKEKYKLIRLDASKLVKKYYHDILKAELAQK